MRARRLELLLGREALFVAGAQRGAQRLQAVARRGQRLLGLAAPGELALQRFLDRRPVHRLPFARQLGQERTLLRDVRDQRLAPALEVGDAVAHAAFGEPRLLRRTFGGAQPLATARLFNFAFVAGMPRRIAPCDIVVQARLEVGDRARLGRLLRRLCRFLRGDVVAFLRQLRAALGGGLGRLLQLDELEVEVVHAALLRRERLAFAVVFLLPGLETAFERLERDARRRGGILRRRQCRFEFGELALADDDTVQFAVGREEQDALRADQVAFRRHERFALSQRRPVGERGGQRIAAANAVEAVGDEARDVGHLEAHLADQRIAAGRGSVARGFTRIGREPRGRRRAVAHPALRVVEPSDLERLQPFAQHGFERVFPAPLDVERLPQLPCAPEALVRKPRVGIGAVADLPLQLGQRLPPCIKVGQTRAFALPVIAGRALLGLQFLHGGRKRGKAGFAVGELPPLECQLFLDVAHRIGRGNRNLRELCLQARAALRELGQRLRQAVAPRLGDAHVLLGLRDLILEVVLHGRRSGHRLVQRRQRRLRGAFLVGGTLAGGQRGLQRLRQRIALGIQAGVLPAQGANLLGQLRHLLRQPRFAFARERELLLEPCHLGIGRVVRTLLVVQRVARGVVLGPQALELRFGAAHFRLHGFQRDRQRTDFTGMAFACAGSVLLLRVPRHVLRLLQA